MDERNEEADLRKRLEQRLDKIEGDAERSFNLYNRFDHAVFWCGMLASLAATVMAALGKPTGMYLAIVTALGPTMLAAGGRLKRGANWHKQREITARGFNYELEFEGAKVESTSKRLREFEDTHERAWQGGVEAERPKKKKA